MEKIVKSQMTIAMQAPIDEIEAVIRRAYIDQFPVWLTTNPSFDEFEGYITKQSQDAICIGCHWIHIDNIRCIEFA